MKVLLAMDGSQSSELALQALIATGYRQKTEVRVMYVLEIGDVHINTDRQRSAAARAMWAIQVREWDPEIFHRRVFELEKNGYVWQRETYRVTAEMDPETGEVIHLYTIDMCAATQSAEPGKGKGKADQPTK